MESNIEIVELAVPIKVMSIVQAKSDSLDLSKIIEEEMQKVEGSKFKKSELIKFREKLNKILIMSDKVGWGAIMASYNTNRKINKSIKN